MQLMLKSHRLIGWESLKFDDELVAYLLPLTARHNADTFLAHGQKLCCTPLGDRVPFFFAYEPLLLDFFWGFFCF
jgi:hypothetical protein